jgi:hypothetical protein
MVAAILAKIGRRIADTFRRHTILLRLWCWIAAAAATLSYIWLRGIADDTGMPREQGALRLDRLIGLGTTPTERLQGWFYRGSAQPFD